MAIKFTDLQGKASKAGPDRYKPVDGINRIRIVGQVVPGYKYWLKTKDGSAVPMDCLSFDRDEEQFTNKQVDYVRKYFPEMKCSWAYQSYVLDRDDGNKLKLFDHKKKLFEQILHAAKAKLGDPTDVKKGWDIVFSRKKTGPKTFNVEYTLETFELEPSALTPEELEIIKAAPPLEEVLKLPTPEEQKNFIETYILGTNEEEEEVPAGLDEEETDDIPF